MFVFAKCLIIFSHKTNPSLARWISQSGINRSARILCIADEETYLLCVLVPMISVHKSADRVKEIIKTTLRNMSHNFLPNLGKSKPLSVSTTSSTTSKNTPDSCPGDFLHSPQMKYKRDAQHWKQHRGGLAIVKKSNNLPCGIL